MLMFNMLMFSCWFKNVQTMLVERCYICRYLLIVIDNMGHVGVQGALARHGPWHGVQQCLLSGTAGFSGGDTDPSLLGVVRGGRRWSWGVGDNIIYPIVTCLG